MHTFTAQFPLMPLGNSPVIRARDLQFCYKIWLIFNEGICGTEIQVSQELQTEDSLFICLLIKMSFFRPISTTLTWYCVGLQLKWIISAYSESSSVRAEEEILSCSLPLLRKTWIIANRCPKRPSCALSPPEGFFDTVHCMGLAWPGFGSRGAIRAVSVRSCQKLPPCLAKPVPGSSKDRHAPGQGQAS